MNIDELNSKYDNLTQNTTGLGQLVSDLSINMTDQSADMINKLRAIKVINIMLAKVWRRRCCEVADLNELVRKYKIRTNRMRDDLFLRNKMICREQQRSDRLDAELRKLKQGILKTSHDCATVEIALAEAVKNEEQLREELRRKQLECNNVAKMFAESKKEMCSGLKSYRLSAKKLAEQQKQNRLLEIRNADLEDELRTLKDRFQTQHDKIVVAVHLKQESLNETYELLKGNEQELAELELKYNDLLKENRNNKALLQICEERRGFGLLHNVISILTGNHWQLQCACWANFKLIADDIARFLDYMHHTPFATPSLPASSMGLCLAIMFIIGVFC